MKNLIIYLVLVLMFNNINGYSQSRENSEKVLKIGEFKSWVKGDDISGWDFDKGEEWKERKGYLRVGEKLNSIDISEKYNNLKDSKSKSKQNFNEIGILEIEYKGEKYVGFGIEKSEGQYEYPTIYENWYTYKTYYVYLFKGDELLKLKNLNGELNLKVYVETYGDPLHRDKEYKSCYDNLKYLLEKDKNSNQFFKFKKTESDGKEVVRFLIPQRVKTYGTTEFIDFENHYFEVNLEVFNNLIKTLNEY